MQLAVTNETFNRQYILEMLCMCVCVCMWWQFDHLQYCHEFYLHHRISHWSSVLFLAICLPSDCNQRHFPCIDDRLITRRNFLGGIKKMNWQIGKTCTVHDVENNTNNHRTRSQMFAFCWQNFEGNYEFSFKIIILRDTHAYVEWDNLQKW